jgi:Rad3-related DNA helicase
MSYSNWKEHFTKPNTRKNQDTALNKISKALDDGNEFVVAEIPTGVGKSDIAMTLAKCTESSYIATSLNVLVDQYNNDFKKDSDFSYVKGARNYECDTYGDCRRGVDSNCPCSKEPKDGTLNLDSDCPYKRQRNLTINSRIALTNLTYFAVAVPNSEHWKMRNLAVLDESHNLPNEILNLVSLTVTDKQLRDLKCYYDISTNPYFNKSYNLGEQIDVLEYSKFLTSLKEDCLEFIEDNKDKKDLTAVTLSQEALEIVQRIDYFFESYEEDVEWLVTMEEIKYKSGAIDKKLNARPLYAGWFARHKFFKGQASQYLMQSATIIDSAMYMKELDIVGSPYIQEVSPFDINKCRPVFCMNSGIMTYKEISNSMLRIVKDINLIMACYAGKKGIIHTVSYDLQKRLAEAFKDNSRCMFMDNFNKEEMLKSFDESSDAVLFSPALTEGFDGKGDRLRFQVLIKIPYPSLGDLRVKIKAERDRKWYMYETKKPIIQAVGRGMRSEDDWCDFYVLDNAFEKFVAQNMPKEFQNTVVSGRGAAVTRASKIYQNLV